MAWVDRLRPEIKFSSPSGQEFSALWKGDSISAEKRLGRHAYPNMDKEVVQDLGMGSRDVPLTVWFDGADHDKEAWRFEAALHEAGPWRVTHPVYGLFRLQLVSYKLSAEPVEGGNVTKFETEWIDFFDEEEVSAVVDPAAAVEVAVGAVAAATVADFAAVSQETVSQCKAVENAVRQNLSAAKGTFRAASAPLLAMQARLAELAASPRLDTGAIAGGIVDLVAALARLMPGNAAARVSSLAAFAGRVAGNFPFAAARDGAQGGEGEGEPRREYAANVKGQVNSALAGQAFLNAVAAAMGSAAISGPLGTRREALAVYDKYRHFTADSHAALDGVARATGGRRIDEQFVARAASGEAVSTLNAAVTRYLMGEVYDLKIERRITLARPRATQEVAITEYGAGGEDADECYESFCRTNHLHGKELLLLPAGREVAVYA